MNDLFTQRRNCDSCEFWLAAERYVVNKALQRQCPADLIGRIPSFISRFNELQNLYTATINHVLDLFTYYVTM